MSNIIGLEYTEQTGLTISSPKGLFAPGFKTVGAYFNDMFEGIQDDRLNNGC